MQDAEEDFFQPAAQKNVSLQDGFKKFLNDRKTEIRKRKEMEEKQIFDRSSDDVEYLRKKFVDLCRSYIGIPYGKKYHLDPESPHYNAPLYLDCCALIRKVLRDMKEDLGFEVGPWNQAYQFDTLPVRLESHDQLKPGDLVFYEGTYVKPGCKPQKHDMVHVEVFVGGASGEASIGARWNTGVITEWESFKFQPKAWSLIRHHFCSIDTWLKGCCKSACSEHAWQLKRWEPGKKSIFGIDDDNDDHDNNNNNEEEEEEEEADQAASPDDD